jgi:hypothetical protein
MVRQNARRVALLLLAAVLLAAPPASATSHGGSPADTSELTEMSSPSDGWDGLPWPALDAGVPRVVFDIAVLRPLGFVQSVVGVAAFVIFYPVSLLTGGSDDVIRACITQPFDQTFRRPLGE